MRYLRPLCGLIGLLGLLTAAPLTAAAAAAGGPEAPAIGSLASEQADIKRAVLDLTRSTPQPARPLSPFAAGDDAAGALRTLDRADYPAAIADLQAASGRDTRTQLLLARLLAAYGLGQEAAQVLEHVLGTDSTVDAQTRARAWGMLGEDLYRRDDIEAAEAAFARAAAAVPAEALPPLVRLLRGQNLMALGRNGRAADVLAAMPDTGWNDYARYNLGAAWLAAGQPERGLALLDALGRSPAADEEGLGIRDRANVALGFYYLDRDRAAEAKAAFERVRTTGPFSDQALLGLGWTEWRLKNWKRALVPWGRLQASGADAQAASEAAVMSAETLAVLGSHAQAAKSYREAIRICGRQLAVLDAAIKTFARAGLPAALLREGRWDPIEGSWRWDGAAAALPGATELAALLAGDRFQTVYGDYRDLGLLQVRLAGPQDASAVPALRQRLEQTRRRQEQWLAGAATAELERRRERVQAELLRARYGLAHLLDDMTHGAGGGR